MYLPTSFRSVMTSSSERSLVILLSKLRSKRIWRERDRPMPWMYCSEYSTLLLFGISTPPIRMHSIRRPPWPIPPFCKILNKQKNENHKRIANMSLGTKVNQNENNKEQLNYRINTLLCNEIVTLVLTMCLEGRGFICLNEHKYHLPLRNEFPSYRRQSLGNPGLDHAIAHISSIHRFTPFWAPAGRFWRCNLAPFSGRGNVNF